MTLATSDSDYFESSFVLSHWVRGTDIMAEIIDQIECRVVTLHKMLYWKNKHLIIPKPSLSSSDIFTFWVHETIIDEVLHLPGVRGGFRIKCRSTSLPDSSTYKGKKQSPRPRRILLDIGSDTPRLIQQVSQKGLEVELLWTHVADLLHYEIVELCTSQYIDLLVTTNSRLLMPPEEWLEFLIPHRTRIIVVPEEKLESPKELAQLIYRFAHSKRKFKTRKHQYHSFLNSYSEET